MTATDIDDDKRFRQRHRDLYRAVREAQEKEETASTAYKEAVQARKEAQAKLANFIEQDFVPLPLFDHISANGNSVAPEVRTACLLGYEGEPCPKCGKLQLVRSGDKWACDACKARSDDEADALDMELLSALYATSGAHERWRNLREVGANDDTLRQAISREFEERGDASGVCGSPGHMVKGSQEPKFWLGQDSSGKPTLVGSELLAKVRILLAIGQPKPGDVPNLKNILAAHPGLLLLFRVGESCLFPHQPHVQEAAKYGVPASFCVNDEAAMIKKLLNAGCRVGVCEPVKDSTVVPVACDMSAVLESGAVEEEIPITRDMLLTGVPGLHPDTVSTLSQCSVKTVADVLFRAARSPGEKLSDRIWSAVRNIASYIDAEEATRAARVLAEIGLQLGEVDAPSVKKTRQNRKRKEASADTAPLFGKEGDA